MILHVPNVLNEPQVSSCREVLNNATWVDGRVTAGSQSAGVKDNRQLPEDSPEARKLGEMIIAALERYPLFISASLLLRVFPAAVQPVRSRHIVRVTQGDSTRLVPHRVWRSHGLTRTY
jgi:predicted 2-oxoglutarate/Fe(II)-dependent dioxygenase YbiX